MIDALTTHLWQSTIFAGVAGLLTLAFRANRARVRYWLWMGASFKFLIPFALLTTLGSYIRMWAPPVHKIAAATPVLSYATLMRRNTSVSPCFSKVPCRRHGILRLRPG
jgi:hypothetical protein